MTTVDVDVWLLIDSDGRAVADCLPAHLKDEYEADHGRELDPSTPARVVKLTVTVALPRPAEVRCAVPCEVADGVRVG